MKIRNLEINTGKPAVCVPVTDTDRDDIISHISDITMQTDMLEWRMDYFSELNDMAYLSQTINDVRDTAGDTPVIFTIRTAKEGGRFIGDAEEYMNLLTFISRSGCADIIDVEYDTISEPERFIDTLHYNDVRVIASHHDFKKTPSGDEMYYYLDSMKDAGADIVKLAVMPEASDDVLSLLSVTNMFHEEHPALPVVTMSMGKLGTVSRISGGTFGSCITFGADREASAPGQLEYLELREIIRIIDQAGK